MPLTSNRPEHPMATCNAPREFAVTPPSRDPRLMIALLVMLPLLLAFSLVFMVLGHAHTVAPALQPGTV